MIVFLVLSDQTKLFFHINFQVVFLLISESESGLKNQAFGKGGIAKIDFGSNWISHDSRIILFIVLGGLGVNFHDFCRLGEWLQI